MFLSQPWLWARWPWIFVETICNTIRGQFMNKDFFGRTNLTYFTALERILLQPLCALFSPKAARQCKIPLVFIPAYSRKRGIHCLTSPLQLRWILSFTQIGLVTCRRMTQAYWFGFPQTNVCMTAADTCSQRRQGNCAGAVTKQSKQIIHQN